MIFWCLTHAAAPCACIGKDLFSPLQLFSLPMSCSPVPPQGLPHSSLQAGCFLLGTVPALVLPSAPVCPDLHKASYSFSCTSYNSCYSLLFKLSSCALFSGGYIVPFDFGPICQGRTAVTSLVWPSPLLSRGLPLFTGSFISFSVIF